MYLVYQYGKINPIALCLTKTSADDISKFVEGKRESDTYHQVMEPVDLDQFVKNRED